MFILLVFSLISLWFENILCVITILFSFLRLFMAQNMVSLGEYFCALE